MADTGAQDVAAANGADRSALRCVVLLCPGEALPLLLRKALEKREICVQECCDPLAAMTTLCLLARPAHGRLSGARLILLVIEPERQSRLDDFLSAVERYVPGVTCRAYRQSEPDRITTLEAGVAHPPSPEPSSDADAPASLAIEPAPSRQVEADEKRTAETQDAYRQGRQTGQPQLRLTVIDGDAEAPTGEEPERSDSGLKEPLTAEELAMLLADDEEESER